MKRIYTISIALGLLISGCNGQTKNHGQKAEDMIKPQSNIKVNKQYDSNGNLIGYDSTYSYYYSNVNKNKNLRDSIFNNFRNKFDQKFSSSNEPFFDKFFFQDSLLKYDFYKKDFFTKRFRENMDKMDSLFMNMDVFKNDFFRKQFDMPAPLRVPKK